MVTLKAKLEKTNAFKSRRKRFISGRKVCRNHGFVVGTTLWPGRNHRLVVGPLSRSGRAKRDAQSLNAIAKWIQHLVCKWRLRGRSGWKMRAGELDSRWFRAWKGGQTRGIGALRGREGSPLGLPSKWALLREKFDLYELERRLTSRS